MKIETDYAQNHLMASNPMPFCQIQIWKEILILKIQFIHQEYYSSNRFQMQWLNLEILYLIPIVCYVLFAFSESLEHKNNVANFSSIDLMCFNIWFCEENKHNMISFLYSQNFIRHVFDTCFTTSYSICCVIGLMLNVIKITI